MKHVYETPGTNQADLPVPTSQQSVSQVSNNYPAEQSVCGIDNDNVAGMTALLVITKDLTCLRSALYVSGTCGLADNVDYQAFYLHSMDFLMNQQGTGIPPNRLRIASRILQAQFQNFFKFIELSR
jgi:hypothetical protein